MKIEVIVVKETLISNLTVVGIISDIDDTF
jgi:hypothetical protein